MNGYLTIMEASRPENLDRSPGWIRAGIKVGKIKAEKVGNLYVISEEENAKIRQNPVTISRKEMLG